MSRIDGLTVCKTKVLKNPEAVYDQAMNMVKNLARHGLIHCDFNEFNLMIDASEKLYVIDFPQMVSTAHINAEMYFQRDVECVKVLFNRKFHFCNREEENVSVEEFPADKRLDQEIKASGFGNDKETTADMKNFDALEAVYEAVRDEEDSGEEDDESESEANSEDANESAGSLVEEEEEGMMPEKKVKKNSITMDAEEIISGDWLWEQVNFLGLNKF